MTDQISNSNNTKTAANESSLPLRVLLPRALAAMVIGSFIGWFLCYGLGHLFFPSAFKDSRVNSQLLNASLLSIISIGSVSLCRVLWKGGTGAKGIASGLCVWFGSTFFFIPLLYVLLIGFYVFNGNPILGGQAPQPVPNSPPNLLQLSPQLMLWANIIPTIAGAILLYQLYKSRQPSEWRSDMRNTLAAIFKPQERHRLERFVLQSPLSPDECRARLPQIANVETSKFAFWEKLPLPGFKPLDIKIEDNHWNFTARYKKVAFVVNVDLAERESCTELWCVSRWSSAARALLLVWFGNLCLFTVPAFFIGLSELIDYLSSPASKNSGPVSFPAIAICMWIMGFFMLRSNFWKARKQEWMVVEAMERVLDAKIIERETVRYKWGLFEEKPKNVPTNS